MTDRVLRTARRIVNTRFPASRAVPAWPNWLGLIFAGLSVMPWYFDQRIIIWLLSEEIISEASTRALPATIRNLSLLGMALGFLASFRVFLWPILLVARVGAVRDTFTGLRSFLSPYLTPLWAATVAVGRALVRWSVAFAIALRLVTERIGSGIRAGFVRTRSGISIILGYLATLLGAVARFVLLLLGRAWLAIATGSNYLGRRVTTVSRVIGRGLGIGWSGVDAGGRRANGVLRRAARRIRDATGLVFGVIGGELASGSRVTIRALRSAARAVIYVVVGVLTGSATVFVYAWLGLWIPARLIGRGAYSFGGRAAGITSLVGRRVYSFLLRVADAATDALGFVLRKLGTGLVAAYPIISVPVSTLYALTRLALRSAAHVLNLAFIGTLAGLAAVFAAGGVALTFVFDYLRRGFLILVLISLVALGSAWIALVAANTYLTTGFAVFVRSVASGLRYVWSLLALGAGYAGVVITIAIGYLWIAVTFGLEYLRRVAVVAALILLVLIGTATLGVAVAFRYQWRGVRVSALGAGFVLRMSWLAVAAVLGYAWIGMASAFRYTGHGLAISARAFGHAVAFAWSGFAMGTGYLGHALAISARAFGHVVAFAWSGFAMGLGYVGHGLVISARVFGHVVAFAWSGFAMGLGYVGHGLAISARAFGHVVAFVWADFAVGMGYLGRGLSIFARVFGHVVAFTWSGFAMGAGYLGRGLSISARAFGHVVAFAWSGFAMGLGYVAHLLSIALDYMRRVAVAATLVLLALIGVVVLGVANFYGYLSRGFLTISGALGYVSGEIRVIAAGVLRGVGRVVAVNLGYLNRGGTAAARTAGSGLGLAWSVVAAVLAFFGLVVFVGFDHSRRAFIAATPPVVSVLASARYGGAVTINKMRTGISVLLELLGRGASVVYQAIGLLISLSRARISGSLSYLWFGASAAGNYTGAGTVTVVRPLVVGGATSAGMLWLVIWTPFLMLSRAAGFVGRGASVTVQFLPAPRILAPAVVAAMAGVVFFWAGVFDGDSAAPTVQVSHWTTGHLTRDGLLKEMAVEFNNANHRTSSGTRIVIGVYDAPSELQGEYLTELLINGIRRDLNNETNGYVVKNIPDPTIVTPSSAHWLVSTNYEIGLIGMDPVVDLDSAQSIVRPVIGIVTYEEMARCLGWPEKEIGFEEIIALRNDPQGWAAYPCANLKEWGQRPLLAFTDPTTSSTGRSLHLALYSFAAGKKPDQLNVEDVTDSDVVSYVKDFQGLIDHYLIGTTVLNTKIYQGPKYGHFFVMPEDNLIHLYEGTESSFFNGVKTTAPPITERMVMIYPKEGSMPRNNCACIVDADWVTPEQVEASQQWIDFIREDRQQRAFMAAGFRPGTDIDLNFAGSKINSRFGLDPNEPRVVVNPSLTPPAVAAAIDEAWDDVKRPGIVTFVADTSASMLLKGKLGEAKDGMERAFAAMAPNNSVGLVTFNDDVSTAVAIAPLSQNRAALDAAVQYLKAVGETALYDAIKAGIEMTDAADGDESSIRAVVVLTDGLANKGDIRLDDLIYMSDPGERLIEAFAGVEDGALPRGIGGVEIFKDLVTGIGLAIDTSHPVQIFFIGIGDDADLEIGRMLAEATGGEFQNSSEEDLAETLEEFSAYF